MLVCLYNNNIHILHLQLIYFIIKFMFPIYTGSELHFRVVVVSEKFEDTPMLQVIYTAFSQVE